jgi:hypothetical protein
MSVKEALDDVARLRVLRLPDFAVNIRILRELLNAIVVSVGPIPLCR